MKGSTVAMTLALIVAGVTAVPLSGVAQPGDAIEASVDALQSSAPSENETEETPPGARLSAVVGAQEAEVHGEIDSRAFEVALERAGSPAARARVVDERVSQLEGELEDLDERKRELQRAYRNGNITTGTYVAELTALTARSESARGLANQSHAAARELPSEAAQRQGLNVTAIGQLEQRAANMTGPEVAEIARSIAGPSVGRPVSAGPPDHAGPPVHAGSQNDSDTPPRGGSGGPPDDDSAGPPDDPGNAAGTNVTEDVANGSEDPTDEVDDAADDPGSVAGGSNESSDGSGTGADDAESAIERAEERVTAAEERVDDLEADGTDVDATVLADAEAAVDAAQADLDAARTALEDGDFDDARELAEQAVDRAERTGELVDDATGEGDDE